MKCVICKEGEYRAGLVTVVLTRDESTVVIKKVPGHVCTQCGEYELDSEVLKSVLAIAESAFQKHAEVEIIRFVA
jgi:YgiT-type zinc finger domain-containing protein